MVWLYTILSLSLICLPYSTNAQLQTPSFSNTLSPPCFIPPCIDVCQPFRRWGEVTAIKPYCFGHPSTRCQLEQECNQVCFARYFDDITGFEITNCQLIYSIVPPPPNPPPLDVPVPTIPITPSTTSSTSSSTQSTANNIAPNPSSSSLSTSSSIAPNPPLSTCPLPGESCTDTGADCCITGGIIGTTRCDGGICCVRSGMEGCQTNTDCCSSRRVCINGRCERNGGGSRAMSVQQSLDNDGDKGGGLGKYVSIQGTLEGMLWISFILIIGTCCSIMYWCGKTVEFQETFGESVERDVTTDCSELSDV